MRDRTPTWVDPVCIECGAVATLTPAREVYPNRSDLWGKSVYVCQCGARVGCHDGTDIPLGRPCGAKTALARDKAHRVFDPLWKRKVERGSRKGKARDAAYKWLAGQMGLTRETCHISWFNEAQCREVVELCRPYQRRIDANRRREAENRYRADRPVAREE